MKFLHTGDLHIGKVLHEMSLLEDQKYILKEIVKIAEQEKVDAVVVASIIEPHPSQDVRARQVNTISVKQAKMINLLFIVSPLC